MTDTTDDYGYLFVHFIEDPDGYWLEIVPAGRLRREDLHGYIRR